jgi:hypothetical protein
MRVSKLLAIVGAILLGLVGLFGFYTHVLQRRAVALVHGALDLSNYQHPPLPVAELRVRYGERLHAGPDCTSHFCVYEIVVSNGILAAFHLVPYTELRSNFWVRDGVVTENMLDYMTSVKGRRNIVAHAAVQFQESELFYLHPWNDSSPVETNGFASISAGSTAAKKRAVLGLNVKCLVKLGGCSTIAELLPTIWQRTSKNQISCRIPNHEGMVDAPPDWNTYR